MMWKDVFHLDGKTHYRGHVHGEQRFLQSLAKNVAYFAVTNTLRHKTLIEARCPFEAIASNSQQENTTIETFRLRFFRLFFERKLLTTKKYFCKNTWRIELVIWLTFKTYNVCESVNPVDLRGWVCCHFFPFSYGFAVTRFHDQNQAKNSIGMYKIMPV